jgi:hypothetical protein
MIVGQVSGQFVDRGIVWVVTIDGIADTVVAVATDKATALHWAGVKAAEYLNAVEVLDEGGERWNASTVAEYYGYHATKLVIDGEAKHHH